MPIKEIQTVRPWPAMRARVRASAIAAVTVMLVVSATPAYAQYFEIANRKSNSRIDVIGASTVTFQGAFLWPNNSSFSQEFEILNGGNGYFRIKARHSGKCLMLDFRQGFYDRGTPLIQHPDCSVGYEPGEWYTVTLPSPPCMCFNDPYIVIVNRWTGMCLDARNPSGGTPGDQSVLQQWDCISSINEWNANNQLWLFKDATSTPPPIIH